MIAQAALVTTRRDNSGRPIGVGDHRVEILAMLDRMLAGCVHPIGDLIAQPAEVCSRDRFYLLVNFWLDRDVLEFHISLLLNRLCKSNCTYANYNQLQLFVKLQISLQLCNCMNAILIAPMGYKEAVELLRAKADDMGLSQKELAGKAHLSMSQVSRIFSLQSTASAEALAALARAVDYPEDGILRLAKRMSPKPDEDPWVAEMEYKLRLLKNEDRRRVAERTIQWLVEEEENTEISETKPRPRRPRG